MENNLYTLFQKQLSLVENQMLTHEESETVKILKQPMNEIIVNFPVKLENGETVVLKGYRIQHNNFRGAFKGGLRFHEIVNLDECKALAGWMTIKCALQELPYGGGKGGIKFNSRDYSKEDLERISREFCNAIHNYIGSDIDIPAPDVGTNSQIMDWMTSEYNIKSAKRDMAVFTGKSVKYGGSHGRSAATGQGVTICIREYAKWKNIDLKGKTYVLQGFGNVGSYTAQLLNTLGMVCVGVGDYSGYLTSTEGFNIHKLSDHAKAHGCIGEYESGLKVSKEEFFQKECEFMIPAALELQITSEIANSLKCKTIVEAANGPTTHDADDVLKQKNIDILPDVLCNSGGVVVSYYEWLQNLRYETWSKEYIEKQLDERMVSTFSKVVSYSETKKCSLREACYVISVENLAGYNH